MWIAFCNFSLLALEASGSPHCQPKQHGSWFPFVPLAFPLCNLIIILYIAILSSFSKVVKILNFGKFSQMDWANLWGRREKHSVEYTGSIINQHGSCMAKERTQIHPDHNGYSILRDQRHTTYKNTYIRLFWHASIFQMKQDKLQAYHSI